MQVRYETITTKKQLRRNRIFDTVGEAVLIPSLFALMVAGKCFSWWIGVLLATSMLYAINWARWKKNLDVLHLDDKPVQQFLDELPEG